MTESLNHQTDLVTHAASVVQGSVDALYTFWTQLRSDLAFLFTNEVEQVMNVGLLPHMRAAIAARLQSFEIDASVILLRWLNDAAHVGAAMVTDVLSLADVLVPLPEVEYVLHTTEVLEMPALDRLERFIWAFRSEISQCLYRGMLAAQRVLDVLRAVLLLMPSTIVPIKGKYTWRLATIGYTEVGRAVSEGTQAMLDVAELSVSNLHKKWMRTSHSGGRPGHDVLHGVTISPHEMFQVAPGTDISYGEAMRFPRDLMGSMYNVVNCQRCFIVPTLGS